MNETRALNRRYPTSLWVYIGLLALFILDATLFSSASIYVNPFNVAIFGLLLAGLLAGNRICRWILIALSLITAFTILAIMAGDGNFADAMLVVIPLGQTAILLSPSARDFTEGHIKRSS